jgi:hypothetical protein
MRATLPRHIQAAGLWLLVVTLVFTPLTMLLIRTLVPATYESFGGFTYSKTWPENQWVFAIGVLIGFVSIVLFLIGAALRLTQRSSRS